MGSFARCDERQGLMPPLTGTASPAGACMVAVRPGQKQKIEVFSRRFSESERYVRTKREPPLSKGGAERLRGGGIPAESYGLHKPMKNKDSLEFNIEDFTYEIINKNTFDRRAFMARSEKQKLKLCLK